MRGLSHSFDIQFARKSNIASIFSLLLQTNDIFPTSNSIFLATSYSFPKNLEVYVYKVKTAVSK